ncbi:MAG: glycine cleavage T C-terminal barrel domain-containing protein [Bdellovibrionota bacterium]
MQSDWSVLEITGKDRVRFLHNLLSQHVDEQKEGKRRWSTLLNSKGKLIGFFQVWKLENRFLLVVHQAHKLEVFKTLETYWITEDLNFKWLEDQVVVSIFGSTAESLPQIEGVSLAVDDYFIPSVQAIVNESQKQAIQNKYAAISPELYEAIRIQSEFPLPEIDYTDPIPLEVPFMHRAVSFVKGCYVGQETIARLHARGLNVSKKLLPFECAIDSHISPQASVMEQQTEVGKVTSLAFSPTQKEKIGLAWVHRNAFKKNLTVNGQAIEVQYE